MDEKEYKKSYRDINHAPCVFAKAILRQCCACSRAEKLFIAEREAIACKSPGAHQICEAVLNELHQKARFALHLTHPEEILPHGKELKVQCGGLLGLQAALHPERDEATRVEDIYELLTAALERHDDTESLPYGQVVRGITRFQPRPGKGQ